MYVNDIFFELQLLRQQLLMLIIRKHLHNIPTYSMKVKNGLYYHKNCITRKKKFIPKVILRVLLNFVRDKIS